MNGSGSKINRAAWRRRQAFGFGPWCRPLLCSGNNSRSIHSGAGVANLNFVTIWLHRRFHDFCHRPPRTRWTCPAKDRSFDRFAGFPRDCRIHPRLRHSAAPGGLTADRYCAATISVSGLASASCTRVAFAALQRNETGTTGKEPKSFMSVSSRCLPVAPIPSDRLRRHTTDFNPPEAIKKILECLGLPSRPLQFPPQYWIIPTIFETVFDRIAGATRL
jgi:hypothetical protein